jgi:glucoamylase
MPRARLSLAVLVAGLLLLLPSLATAQERWTAADKRGFGTAHDTRSKVWFTLGDTRMDEVYWPDIGSPAVRGLELEIGDERESSDATGQVGLADPRSLTYRQVSTAKSGAWRVTKTYVTDPARDVVLIAVDVRSLTGRPLRVSADLQPGLDEPRGRTALLGSPALGRGARLPVDGVGSTQVTLALGFGRTAASARSAAAATLQRGWGPVADDYALGWQGYLGSLPPRPAAAQPYAALYDASVMVLAASEDKTYRGASVASPSMPWFWGVKGKDPSAVYHLVWSRDLYQVASAQLAAGDRAAAERSLDFLLFRQQKDDGSYPQNSKVDGTEVWTELQMDQVALPLVLAWQLGRTDPQSMAKIRKAADFLARKGPITGQERWENQAGWSPATIAAEIAGLICAADLARRTGDPATAARWEAVADGWQRNVERWTATTNGPLSAGPYYLRVTKDRAPNRPTTYSIGDSGPAAADQRRVVDPSFLELVRLGVKPASDPTIVNSTRVVDEQLKVVSRLGTFWHRFSYDGYGETATGKPWEIAKKPDTYKTWGRAWPLLTGERGEYELASGRPATDHLRWMAGAASDGLMLPEQVWDGRPPSSGTAFTPGKGTFSATPLAWSHAQFVRLARSIDAGAPVERPAIVACRYAVVCR